MSVVVRARLVTIVCLLGSLFAGCESGESDVKSDAARPSSSGSVRDADREVSACSGDDLKLKPRWGAAAGSFGGSWYFTNHTDRTCVLEKGLVAEVVDGSGRVLVRSEPNRISGRPRIALAPEESASAIVLWSNWCKDRHGTFIVRILLAAHSGSVQARAPGPATCTGPPSTSKISISSVRRAQR